MEVNGKMFHRFQWEQMQAKSCRKLLSYATVFHTHHLISTISFMPYKIVVRCFYNTIYVFIACVILVISLWLKQIATALLLAKSMSFIIKQLATNWTIENIGIPGGHEGKSSPTPFLDCIRAKQNCRGLLHPSLPKYTLQREVGRWLRLTLTLFSRSTQNGKWATGEVICAPW